VARTLPFPFKRRTREHVIAAQSVNHVERFVIDAGHVPQRMGEDYGYDLVLQTFDGQGYVEPGFVRLQLKASETWPELSDVFPFDLDVKDYNLWLREPQPVILVLFAASRRKAYWLHVQRFFEENPDRRPRARAKTIRVHVPRRQIVNLRAIGLIRAAKQESLAHAAQQGLGHAESDLRTAGRDPSGRSASRDGRTTPPNRPRACTSTRHPGRWSCFP